MELGGLPAQPAPVDYVGSMSDNGSRSILRTPMTLRSLLSTFSLCSIAILALSAANVWADAGSPPAAKAPAPVIILGFVGGFVRHDNPHYSEVRLAARLRQRYTTGAVVETYSNHSGNSAYRRILELLDADHDGNLSVEEKQSAQIILYGHSWGASETIDLARRLQGDSIPVLLTVQVDSVSKLGQNDRVIPANVAQAANFYQEDGLLQGKSEIRAADPHRTQIDGNFRYEYAHVPYDCIGYPWYDRIFMKAHTQIESDPKVWAQVETLIQSTLLGQAKSGPTQTAAKP
jgi:hypothetical protein